MDISRHIAILDTSQDKNQPHIHIAGCGSVGSRFALELARLGFEHVSLWDFDDVASHNIANQSFRLKDVGKDKVEVVKELVKEISGAEYKTYKEKFRVEKPCDIVVMAVDSIEARREIAEEALEKGVKFAIEIRMSSSAGFCYSFRMIPSIVCEWSETLGTDAEADVSSCGAPQYVGATSSSLVSVGVWNLIKYLRGDEYPFMSLISFTPYICRFKVKEEVIKK